MSRLNALVSARWFGGGKLSAGTPLGLALRQALGAQGIGWLIGLTVLLAVGSSEKIILWTMASGLGVGYLILLALSSAAMTGQRSARSAIALGLIATGLRWAVLGVLLVWLGGGELDKTIIALLSCFSYNWAISLVWVGQWLRHRLQAK